MAVHFNAHSSLNTRYIPYLFTSVLLLLGLSFAHAVQTPAKPKPPLTKPVSIDRKPGFSPIKVAYPSKREEPIARIGSAHSDAEVEAQASN